jgi:hypothetical protein
LASFVICLFSGHSTKKNPYKEVPIENGVTVNCDFEAEMQPVKAISLHMFSVDISLSSSSSRGCESWDD